MAGPGCGAACDFGPDLPYIRARSVFRDLVLGWDALPDNVPPVRFVAKNMRLDLRLIAEMIPEGARVLDIGLDMLRDA